MLRLEKYANSFASFESRRKMTPTSNPSMTGEDLTELKRYVLEASRKLLVENVDAPRFLPYFRSRFVLDQRECDQIKSCSRQSRYDGAEKLLDSLLTKGPHGYDHFCAAIMYDRTQMFLLTALNKRLELLRDWRKKQVLVDEQMAQAQAEWQQRIHHQVNRQQLHIYSNRTYPMTTLSSARYQPQPAGARLPPPYQHQLTNSAPYQHQRTNPAPPAQERLARSPIPPEVEPTMVPNGHFPNPQLHHGNYHEFQQLPQQPYPGTLPVYPVVQETNLAYPIVHETNPAHSIVQNSQHAQPVSQHRHLDQPVQQHAHPVQAAGYPYASCFTPPPGQYVPPPAPMGVDYQVPTESSVYHDHFSHYNDPLTLNTPSSARMEHLFPGMPPSPANSSSQSLAQNQCERREVEPDRTTPHHALDSSLPLMRRGYETGLGQASTTNDILCGQGGN